MINMKHILYTISLLVLLGACTDEAFNDEPSAGGSKPGKPVPVNLSLNLQPLQSPLDADTKAGSRVVSSTEVCKGMEISLVKTPVAPETRALADEVKNFWVFQFNGTEPTSTLLDKIYYPNSSVKDVKLIPSTAKNRIIVIANAEKTTFDAVVQYDPKNLNNEPTTLEEFNKLGSDYTNLTKSYYPLFLPTGADPDQARPILAGSTDIIVTSNSQADIMLYRSTAKVNVTLNLVDSLHTNYSSWSYQFMNVPKRSFYHSIGREPAFPGADAQYGSYDLSKIDWPRVNSGWQLSISADLPVNLHHGVPFTTPEKRVTNAPVNSTYLQIMGAETTPDGNGGFIITKSVVYQIHLGSNFTDDYSISPNYDYEYTININGENDDDSRVIKFIPGYFGGKLLRTEYSSEGKTYYTWKYEKRIEVYIKDVTEGNQPGGVWLAGSGASMPKANSFIDGWTNTWNLIDRAADLPAIRKCVNLNGTVLAEADLKWYTPSFGQALGIYVSGSNTLKTLPDASYWTSSTDGQNAWAIKVRSGLSEGDKNPSSSSYYLRCIKDIDPNETVK